MQIAVTSYVVIKAVHVMAVVLAYGLPGAYPLLIPYVRRNHPRAMPGLHDVQHHLNRTLTAAGTVLILVLGVYMATKNHLWDEAWVDVPVAMIVAIGAIGGAVVVPATRRMSELARVDVEAAPAAGTVAWSAAYEREYRRYMAAEMLLGVLVLVAVFFMVAKPFA
jgi:hypothetical protein